MAINIKRANNTTTPAIPSEITQIKTDLALDLVNNTADAAKPISSAVATALTYKTDTGHSHPFSMITGLPFENAALLAAFNGKADYSFTLTSLSGKADVGHVHVIGGITGLQAALDAKQVALVSASTIKTINGAPILGAGDLVVTGAGGAPVQRTPTQLAAAPLAGDIALGATATFQDSTNPALRYVMNAAQTAFVAIAGGGAAQNSLFPGSATVPPAIDAVNLALALKADYLPPATIIGDVTLIRSPVPPATNGFNRTFFGAPPVLRTTAQLAAVPTAADKLLDPATVFQDSVTSSLVYNMNGGQTAFIAAIGRTVTATGAQAIQGDYVAINNFAGVVPRALAGVTARAGYTLVAQPGESVSATCTVNGSFDADTPIAVVASAGGTKVSFFDQPSFMALPRANQASGTPTLLPTGFDLVVIGALTPRVKSAGLRNSIDRAGYDGPNTANSDAGIISNGAFYLFEDRPSVTEIIFAVADSLGVGCTTAVGFSSNYSNDPGNAGEQSKILLGADQSSTQFKIYSNDTVTTYPTQAVINGGVGFPCNDPAVMYKFSVAYFPTGPRRFVWKLINLISAAVATGTLTVATTMPVSLDPVSLYIRRNSRALVGIAKIDIISIASGAFV